MEHPLSWIPLSSPLPRGLYSTGFWLANGSVMIYAVNSAHECIGQALVGSCDEYATARAMLTRELDRADPLPTIKLHTSYTVDEMERIGRAVLDGAPPVAARRRGARKGPATGKPAAPALQLVH